MSYRYRFTLDGDFGSHEIIEPLGWKDMQLSLERDMTYHSLIENFTAPLTFYAGANGEDGGYDYLKTALETGGPDAKVSIEIEISLDDGATYENLFTGLLAVDDHTHIEFYKKIEVPILRDDFWSRFIARKSQDVDLKSTVDLYGNAVTATPDHTLSLSPQKVRQKYHGSCGDEPTYVFTANGYGIFDMGITTFNEIKEKFNYPRVSSTTRPFELFAVEYGGDYAFEGLVTITSNGGNNQMLNVELYLQINDDTPIAFTKAQQGVNGINGTTKFTISTTEALNANDFIRIYFQNTGGAGNDFIMLATEGADQTELEILADTVYQASSVGGIFPYDALSGIAERITGGQSPIVSDFFGGADTVDPYDDDGCGYHFKLFRGLQVRGWSYANKPFTASFDQIFSGLDGIFNLGLGYEADESSPDGSVLRIEEKNYFYDDTGLMESLSDVANIEISFDLELMFNKITIGYNKWEAESDSGIDDPQTKQQYGTPLKVSGGDKDVISGFVAAALALEQTRRVAGLKQGQDWRLDEDVFIVQTDSANSNVPDLISDPVNNLYNPETRYNLKLTPHYNLIRWSDLLSIGLYIHAGSGSFTYRSGEGNQAMDYVLGGGGGGGDPCALTNTIDEDSDISIGSAVPLFKAILYSFKHKMTYSQYKNIRDNRRSALQITYVGNDGHSYLATLFIKKLSFMINQGTVSVDAWVKTVEDLGTSSDGSVFSDEFSEEFA